MTTYTPSQNQTTFGTFDNSFIITIPDAKFDGVRQMFREGAISVQAIRAGHAGRITIERFVDKFFGVVDGIDGLFFECIPVSNMERAHRDRTSMGINKISFVML